MYKHGILGVVSLLALSTGIAHAQTVTLSSSNIETVSQTPNGVTVTESYEKTERPGIPSDRLMHKGRGHKKRMGHKKTGHHMRHHCRKHCMHHQKGTDPRTMVFTDDKQFVPNFSRAIGTDIADQGPSGWDYLGQHAVTYNVYVVDSKTPYYFNFHDLVNNIADWNKSSVGGEIHDNYAVVNSDPDVVFSSISKYTRGKVNVTPVQQKTVWTGDKYTFGKETQTISFPSDTTAESNRGNAAMILNGYVYGPNYLNLDMKIKSGLADVVAEEGTIPSKTEFKAHGVKDFNMNVASGSTFIYEVQPETKHGRTSYIIMSPTITPVVDK